jgi:hypothetical protein
VRGGDENHLPGAGKKVSQFRVVALLVGGAKNLFDDQAAEAVAMKAIGPVLKSSLFTKTRSA